MSNEKFTPGPWNVFDSGLIFVQPPPDSGTLVIAGCGTSFIGDGGEQAQWQIDRNRANAHLIAAAPEMYEKLNELRGYFQGQAEATISNKAAHGFYDDIATKIDVLLQKARGGE